MKLYAIILSALCSLFFGIAFLLTACTSLPTAPTSNQQLAANAVEDLLSVGLVPVLTKNASYLPAAQSIAVALGSFSGSTLAPADVDAFLAKTSLSAADAKTVAGLVNSGWAVYQKRYAATVAAGVRPDVKLFLAAVANGINKAVAAVPKG